MPLQDLPGRDPARELARQELAHRKYQEARPPLLLRLVRWVLDKIGHTLDGAASATAGGGFGLLILLLLLAGLVAVVVVRLRPTAARRQAHQELFGDLVLSAAQHRDRAEQAAAAGQYAEAVRERLRAVVRELESRGVLDPRPGRTAGELAGEAGLVVPGIAQPLARAATVFDEVWYGGRTADAEAYRALVEVDALVRESRLVRA